MKLLNILRRFRKDESGASMVEYGVALLVATAVGVTAMGALGTTVLGKVNGAITALGGTLPT
jgi:pilus assembly protein Flp/PilA